MTMTQILIPTFVNMLTTLSAWLKKAEDQLSPAQTDALLSARLAPDMFPLSTQIRFACVQAQEAAYRLRGEAFPPIISELLDEGRHAGEHPGTLSAAQSRITQTIHFLSTLPQDAVDSAPDAPIAHDLANGMVFDFTAQEYGRDWVLGQFYFHIMIAYAIMRSKGVAIGKSDYIPHLLAHLRAPGAGQAPNPA